MKKILFVSMAMLVFVVSCNLIQPGEISRNSYSKVKVGMSFSAAKRIMGKPTRVIKEVKFKGVSGGTYAWDTNDRSSTFVIGVQNGQVKMKMPPQPMRGY